MTVWVIVAVAVAEALPACRVSQSFKWAFFVCFRYQVGLPLIDILKHLQGRRTIDNWGGQYSYIRVLHN